MGAAAHGHHVAVHLAADHALLDTLDQQAPLGAHGRDPLLEGLEVHAGQRVQRLGVVGGVLGPGPLRQVDRRRDRQGSDRPRLQQVQLAVRSERPLDVLRVAEQVLEPFSECGDLAHLAVVDGLLGGGHGLHALAADTRRLRPPRRRVGRRGRARR